MHEHTTQNVRWQCQRKTHNVRQHLFQVQKQAKLNNDCPEALIKKSMRIKTKTKMITSLRLKGDAIQDSRISEG